MSPHRLIASILELTWWFPVSCCHAALPFPGSCPCPHGQDWITTSKLRFQPEKGRTCPFLLKSWPVIVHIISTYIPLLSSWKGPILSAEYLSPTAQTSVAPSPAVRVYSRWSKPTTVVHSPVWDRFRLGPVTRFWPIRLRRSILRASGKGFSTDLQKTPGSVMSAYSVWNCYSHLDHHEGTHLEEKPTLWVCTTERSQSLHSNYFPTAGLCTCSAHFPRTLSPVLFELIFTFHLDLCSKPAPKKDFSDFFLLLLSLSPCLFYFHSSYLTLLFIHITYIIIYNTYILSTYNVDI